MQVPTHFRSASLPDGGYRDGFAYGLFMKDGEGILPSGFLHASIRSFNSIRLLRIKGSLFAAVVLVL